MLKRLVLASIHFRKVVLTLLGLLLAAGGWAAATLPIDALPDVSTIQVSVLTTASGLTPTEIERTCSGSSTSRRSLPPAGGAANRN